MKLFITKKQTRYWLLCAYIRGYAQGTTNTRNETEAAGVYTWSTKGPHWHNMKRD